MERHESNDSVEGARLCVQNAPGLMFIGLRLDFQLSSDHVTPGDCKYQLYGNSELLYNEQIRKGPY